MRIFISILFLVTLLAGCATTPGPNGMSWDEYNAAEYRLNVAYRAAEVAACQELGKVRGSDI